MAECAVSRILSGIKHAKRSDGFADAVPHFCFIFWGALEPGRLITLPIVRKLLFLLAISFSMNFITVCPAVSQDIKSQRSVKIPKLKPLKEKDMSKTIVPLEKKGEWGFADEEGKFVIKPVFDEVRNFSNGIALVRCKTLWGAIKRDGTYLFEPQFDEISDFSMESTFQDFFAYARNDESWGLLRSNGEITIPLIYEKITRFQDNLFYITNNGKKGLIDGTNGVLILNTQYDSIDYQTYSQCNLGIVVSDNLYGLVDNTGGWILDCEYNSIFIAIDVTAVSNGWACIVKKDGHYGILHNSNVGVIEASYKKVGICYSGLNSYSSLSEEKENIKLYKACGIIAQSDDGDGYLVFNAVGNPLGISISHIPTYVNNGSAIVKEQQTNCVYVIYQGAALSFKDYNERMKVDNYAKDKLLPEWAQIYKQGQSVKEEASADYGDTYPRFVYKSLRLGGFEEIQAYGIVDNKGNWLLKPVIGYDQPNSAGGWAVFPCDIYRSTIIYHDGKYGRINPRGISVPTVINSYEEMARLYGIHSSDLKQITGFPSSNKYYAVISLDCDKDYFYKYGFANQDRLVIPVQYYTEMYGGEGLSHYDISQPSDLGFFIVGTRASNDSRDIVYGIVNSKNEVIEPLVHKHYYELKPIIAQIEDDYYNRFIYENTKPI